MAFRENNIVIAADGAKVRLANTGCTSLTRTIMSFAFTKAEPMAK